MNKKTLSAIALLLLQTTLFSCDKDKEVSPVEEVVPLEVGNEWVYEVKDFDTSGKLLTTSSYKYFVRNDTTINKRTWYILSNGQIVQNSRNGYVYYNKTDNQAVTIYQSPSYGGIGYKYSYQDYELLVLTTRSQQIDTVRLSSGSYASYLFRIENQYKSPYDANTHIINEDNYVSPGIGLVRTDTYYVDSEKIRQRRELVRYTVK